MKLTVKVKLVPTQEQKRSLIKTIEVFNDACNYISGVAFKEKTFGQVGLHHLCYYHVRKTYGLSAQLAVRAIGKVSESYRAEKKRLHVFKKHSAVVYDQRIFSFKGLDTISILSLNGRFKIPIVFGSYAKLGQRRVLGQADLLYLKGVLYLCLCVELPDEKEFTPQGKLGVDLGIVNIATTSDGVSFSGEDVDKTRININTLRKALQKKGSDSAKRHLKKLSGRERRFKRTTNHTIAKKIVQVAKDTQRSISLENLKGFRATVRKEQRERFGKWAFDELGRFISYKARIAGVPVSFVNPRNTSRACSQCGHTEKSNRKSQSEFVCKSCGFTIHADLNGARNIASRGSVNNPIVASTLEPQGVCS
jgi:IS605 OrfB family transposase